MIDKNRSLVEARAQMVRKQLEERYISDPHVLRAMGDIPRHCFVDEKFRDSAYDDGPLPIGYKQTISQPYIVAFMTQALHLPPNRQAVLLEIGTGSGYQAAVLSQLAAKVYSVERIAALAKKARQTLDALDIHNVIINTGDGGYGWPEHGPYDGIIVSAAAPDIPAPLTIQLKDGGRLVAPVGPKNHQVLFCLQRRGNMLTRKKLFPVAFVPLLGEHGWEN